MNNNDFKNRKITNPSLSGLTDKVMPSKSDIKYYFSTQLMKTEVQ